MQVSRMRRVTSAESDSVFIKNIQSVMNKIDLLATREKKSLFRNGIPFLSSIFYPRRHKSIRHELKRNPDFTLRFFAPKRRQKSAAVGGI